MTPRPGAASRGALRFCRAALLITFLAAPLTAQAPPAGQMAAPATATTAPPAILALVDNAIREGRFDAAGTLIARSRIDGDSPQLQLRTAELFLATGDLAAAAIAFGDLLSLPGVAAAAGQGLGLVRLRQFDLPAAITALDAALALDPDLARAWTARGVAADRGRDWPAADAAYARAVALDPGSATILTNRGYSLMLRERFADAEVDLARAVALDPALKTAATNLRFARAMQGRYRDAFLGSTRGGLAADLNTVGFAAMARQDYATAETYFNRALALNSRFDRTAWANLEYLKSQTAPRTGVLPAAESGESNRRMQVAR
ncbi:hypothetical protein GCM10011529_16930 [Polymorphobacter glacialis]|uniref:Tetratricopeptide repeat protein n=1 Tax=Sandarakinorhabdus glacialis TaxID=1614636 RepID=A0A917E799_9SPHN|nr:tetratricopeptide repeat protein [Polymorphobacter glacialis]GGE11181.1 hypothetical protein GCM10011529_16930 [Polymorphobacter glacialis]